MKKINAIGIFSLFSLFMTGCDDGDFEIPSFRFNKAEINSCGDLVLSKMNSSKREVLILKLNIDNTDDVFFKTPAKNTKFTISEEGEHKIIYRIFDAPVEEKYFCQEIPPKRPIVTSEWLGNGKLVINNSIVLDDEDKVSTENEDLNKDGNPNNDDTDKDGYPNYIDIDDDGDNITTLSEDLNKDGNPNNDDTDKDGIPNYLDSDDDNDGVPSLNESKSEDADDDSIVDYLDKTTIDFKKALSPITNVYYKKQAMNIEFTHLNFSKDDSNLNHPEGYVFGVKRGSFRTTQRP